MNILITGGSGFVGQHLVNSLSAKNHVFVVIRKERLFDPNVSVIRADLSNHGYTSSFPDHIDCVIHLAQSTKYRDFPAGVSDMQRVNIDATVELLEWARHTEIKQFIFASTANVYKPSVDILTETSITDPVSFYGATKLCAEHLMRQYQKFFQVNILRLFTIYGSGQQNMLIPNIIERVKCAHVITLAREAGIYLTPIYIADVVKIISQITGLPKEPEIRLLNVCGDRIESLAEIVKVLEALLGRSAVTKITNEEPVFFTGSNKRLRVLIDDLCLLPMNLGLEITLNSR